MSQTGGHDWGFQKKRLPNQNKIKGFVGTLSALDKTEDHFCSILTFSLFLMIFNFKLGKGAKKKVGK